jgi:hypothetical protein
VVGGSVGCAGGGGGVVLLYSMSKLI